MRENEEKYYVGGNNKIDHKNKLNLGECRIFTWPDLRPGEPVQLSDLLSKFWVF
jgi:hypothetical protein